METIITRPVVKICPHRDEIDAGDLVIRFDGAAPELHLLAARIETLAAEPVTHEDFTEAVAALVPGAQVVTTWHTGPWRVEVRAGPVAVPVNA